MEGLGRYIPSYGTLYEGYWNMGTRRGFGVEIRKSGRYIGDWYNNKREGSGPYITPQGTYQGSCVNGKQEAKVD